MPNPPLTLRSRWAPSFVTLIALASAWPAIRCGWSDFDEVYYCRDNLYLLSLKPGNLWILLTAPGPAYQFQPTTYLSHAIDHSLFGESVHAFHAVNVLLYVWVCWLVACLARDVLRDLGASPGKVGWGAFLAGAFFAIHPVHVESFAWLGDRKDLLSAGFGLAAFLTIRRARRLPWARALGHHAGGLALFVIAMGAKATVMPLGCLVLLDAFLIDPKIRKLPLRERALRSLPAGSLVLVLGLILTLLWLAALRSYPINFIGSRPPVDPIYVLRCYGYYVRLLVWPSQLSVYYTPAAGDLALARNLAWLAVGLAAWGWAVARQPRHRAPLFLGGAWLTLFLLPVVNVVYQGYVSDRYLLLPSAGAALILGALLGGAFERRDRLVGLLVALAAVGLLLQTSARLPAWRSSQTLWRSALSVDPGQPWANAKVAAFALEAGRPQEALEHVERALSAAPDSPTLIGLKVRVLEALDRPDAAEALLAEAAKRPGMELFLAQRALARGDLTEAERLLAPLEAKAGWNLAILDALGRLELTRGDPAKALRHFERALEVCAQVETTWLAASAAHRAGQPGKAARYLALLERQGTSFRSTELSARVAFDLFERARVDAAAGAHQPASEQLREALRLDPRLELRARNDPAMGPLLD